MTRKTGIKNVMALVDFTMMDVEDQLHYISSEPAAKEILEHVEAIRNIVKAEVAK